MTNVRREFFGFAIHAWEAYNATGKRGHATAVRWPVNKLESLYANYFGTPLQLGDGGLERLLDEVPIFDIRETGFVSVSKEKLLNFLVCPAVGTDCVDEERFRENFVKATGLGVEEVYKLFNTVTFTDFVQCLSFKCPHFHIRPDNSGRPLLYISQYFFVDCTPQRSIDPESVPLQIKASRKDITHWHASLSGDEACLRSPPRKVHCVHPSSVTLSGEPIPVLISNQRPNHQESNQHIFDQQLGTSFPMSANRGPPAAEKTQAKGKGSRKSRKKKHNAEVSVKPSEPSPSPLTESEFPMLGIQAQPRRETSGDATLHTQNVMPLKSVCSPRTPLLISPQQPRLLASLQQPPSPLCPPQPPSPLCSPKLPSSFCVPQPPSSVWLPQPVCSPRPLSSVTSQQPPSPVWLPQPVCSPRPLSSVTSQQPPSPVWLPQPVCSPPPLSSVTSPQPPSSVCLPRPVCSPRPPSSVCSPQVPLVVCSQQPPSSVCSPQVPLAVCSPRPPSSVTSPRPPSSVCSPLPPSSPQVPLVVSRTDARFQHTPPPPPLVFPNPDAPDEVVPPAHPVFHPGMASASSNLSTALTFTDARGRPDTSQVAAKKIDDRLDAIIDDLASTGKFVPEHVVRDFRDRLVQKCRHSRVYINMRDLKMFDEYCKKHGRVAQLINIFCWMSPITTLYELERALTSTEKVSTFEELRMGPLIKHPLVAKFFQPPANLTVTPEVTAHQIQKTLMKFLDKTRNSAARGEKHSVEEFLQFFAKSLSKPSPFDLCVRITSFPLAIQTNFRFRRMQRESRDCVQHKVEEEVKTIVMHEIDQVRRKLASFCDPHNRHITAKDPTALVIDIFGIFLMYLSGYQSPKVNAFLQLLSNQEQVKQMFLLAIYRGAYGVIERGTGEEEREVLHQSRRQPEEVIRRTRGEVLDVVVRQLNRLPFPIDLSSLAAVERTVAEQFAAPAFQPLTNTSFLDFLVSDAQCKSCLGGSLTIGAAPMDDRRKRKVMDIVSQLRPTERSSQNTVSETLKLQCGVSTVDQIHCGSIEKLISDVNVKERAGASTAAQNYVTHLAPLLVNGTRDTDSYKQWSSPSLGVLGHKTREDASSCLRCAPLLEDLGLWSHWDLVFKPQHGDLSQFIEREGEKSGVYALEIKPGVLLRVDPEASHQKFLQAVEANDPINTAGQLVSLVVQQGSVYEVSLQLLGSHVETALEKLVTDSSQSTDGGVDGALLATQFIYQCLVRIPHKICHFLSKEVFLEPLRRVSSMTSVEDLLSQCKKAQGLEGEGLGRRHLQALGMGLGVKAWTDDFSAMLDEAESSRVVKPKPTLPAHSLAKPYHVDGPTRTSDTETSTHPTISLPVATDMELTTASDDGVDHTHMTLILPESTDPEKEAQCRAIIENIRSEDFGVGLELEGRQKEVVEKQRQREGRGLQRLSKELYSKDTHFVLELIQNADDNSYHESLLSARDESVPALKFIVGPSSVSVLNNEVGFSEKNIRAICDVGRSTKGAHHSGYIGQKGIGFKSVFRVTDTPEIHSGGYHIRFDAKCDAIGYILPHWIDEEDQTNAAVGKGWNTTIVLPLKEDQMSMSLVRKFQDVRPSLLLFLHRLRSITVEHQVSGTTHYMRRYDSGEGIIQILHNTDQDTPGQDTWLVVQKQLTNASQFKAEVEVTEVALAFPLSTDMKTIIQAKDLQQQQVFAFLPLRSYGFRFIVQGDFDLPSSREDVNSDSAWNQYIRDEIPQLFLHALDRIKSLPGLSLTDAVALYLQFTPLDGELHDFFKPVAIQIRNLLRGTACLPSEPGLDDIADPFSIIRSLPSVEPDELSSLPHLWKQPSQLVVVRDPYVRNHIPQSLLNSALHYFYLSSELTPFLNPLLQSHLGVQSLSIDHLIAVAEAVLKSYSGDSHSVVMLSDSDSEDSMDGGLEWERQGRGTKTVHSLFVRWVAQWLACVHIVLEEEGDRSPVTIDKLKKIKIIPLTNGSRMAAQDGSLFFPADGDSVSSATFKGLFDEIKVVDPLMFEIDSDASAIVKPSHRVHSALELLGVREMYPAEVIRHHILPCFQQEQWKSKSQAVLTTYLVYIKDSLGMQGSGVTEAEVIPLLRDCVALATKKHGARQPAKEVLHFSSQFQPSYDFENLFPDVPWMLVSPGYLKNLKSVNAVSLWRSFLQKLGVHNTIAVRRFTENVPEGNDRWQELREFVGRSPDSAYTLRDYKCSEFEEIVRSATSKKQRRHQQMLDLVQLLDKLWDEEYRQYAFAKCYDGSNQNYLGGDKSVPSSFHRLLRDLAWLPAVSFPSGQPYGKNCQLYRGRDLFDGSKANQRLLDSHVPYIATELKNHKLVDLLQIKCHVSAEEMMAFLQEWSQASTAAGAQFRASIAHMAEVYMFFSQQMLQGASSVTDKLSSGDLSLIFVPDTYDSSVNPSQHVVGQFYSIHNVCWVDPSGVLYGKQQYNHNLPPELPKLLQLHYGNSDQPRNQDTKMAFERFGIRETPTAAMYITTLQFISTLAAIPEKHHINDFAGIALHLSRVCMQGHITPQYLQQQLKGNKIFPSHRDLWVSLDSCLLEKDDAQLAKYFSECEDIHFLHWPAIFEKKLPRHMRYQEQQKEDERKHFIDVCGIAKLSEVVHTMVVPKGMVMPLDTLRTRLNIMVPLIQRYLIASEEMLYQSLQQENLKEKFSKMLIVSVLGLDCLYSIHHHGNTYQSPSMSSPGSEFTDSSEEGNAALYVVASKVDSPKCLVPALLKIFTAKQASFVDIAQFENLVKDMLLSPTEEMESILSDTNYSFGEVADDDVWIIPLHKDSEPAASESEDEDGSDANKEDANGAVDAMETGEANKRSGVQSWPPKAPVSVSSSNQYPAKPPPPGSAVADVVGRDDIQKISEKYAMSTETAARPPSRQPTQEHTKSNLPQSPMSPRDYGEDTSSSPLPHSPSSSTQPSLSRSTNQKPSDEGSEQHRKHGTVTRGDADVTTASLTPQPPHEAMDTSVPARNKHHKWHESTRPETVLTQSSFSVAEALQSITVDSDHQLQSVLDKCNQDSHERVGRWGEEYVYKYLVFMKCLPNGQSFQAVTWVNEKIETGKPYDIEVKIEPDSVLYIEVKSTKSARKEFMEFSWNELQFADKEKQNYHLYRVYSAGSEKATLKWMENLSSVLDTHPVRLLLEL